MKKLRPQNQITITKESVAEILRSYSISDFTFEPIHEGIENTSLTIKSAGKKYVLRIYAQDRKSDADITLEISFQDYLRENAIPIPVIYQNINGHELTVAEIDGKRWQLILMEFIEGQCVTPHTATQLVRALAQFQAKMHLLGIEFAKNIGGPNCPWSDLHGAVSQDIDTVSSQEKDVQDFVERAKKYRYHLNLKLPHGYNHLDLDFYGNILTKDNRIQGIIDFDDLAYSPMVVCLGFSLWGILDDAGIDSTRYYLSEYKKIRPLTPVEYETLPHVVFFRNYVIGMTRLRLCDETQSLSYIGKTLNLEKEIPILFEGI